MLRLLRAVFNEIGLRSGADTRTKQAVTSQQADLNIQQLEHMTQ